MVRLAAATDVDEIATVHVRAWQSAYRGHMPDAVLDGLDVSKRAAMWLGVIGNPGTILLVAVVGETLLGFCSLLASRDSDASPAVGEIAAIYVDPTAWRSGIGTALIEATVESARLQKFSELTLWVLTSNSSARAFYEARGFESDGHTQTQERLGFPIHETRYRRRLAS